MLKHLTVILIKSPSIQLTADIVSDGPVMCTAIFSRPIALNTAAQKQGGHVTGGPDRETKIGKTLCVFLNEGRIYGMSVVYININ